MKKKFLALIALLLLFGGTTVAFAYWDNLSQNSTGEYEIGYGVRLEVPTHVEDDRALVPSGSFYSAYEADYTTSLQFVYTLSLEDNLQAGMEADLSVDITDFDVNGVLAQFNQADSLFTVTVGTDAAAASTSATGEWSFTDAFDENTNTVLVYVTIELAPNGAAGFDASDYNLVAGQSADFDIAFELTNSSSSTNNPAV